MSRNAIIECMPPVGATGLFLRRLYESRALILRLAVRSLRARYAGTLLGALWSLLNPILTVVVFWFVFALGFRVKPVGGTPYILVFLCGLIPWTLLNETLSANVNAITGNPHLVKRTVFQTEILPLVNLTANLMVHAVLVTVLVGLVAVSESRWPGFSCLQTVYYLAALCLLSLGLSWLLASLNVYYKDVGAALTVLLNIWFWATPVAWLAEMIPRPWQFIIRLNPLFHIVQGYRQSLIDGVPFWSQGPWAFYVWGFALAACVSGAVIFLKLKPDFADVL